MVKYFSIINKILIILTLCTFIYFCFKLFFPLQRIGVSFDNNDQVVSPKPLKDIFFVPVKSYDYYREQIQKRDIFQFLEDKPAVPKKVKVKKTAKMPVKVLPGTLLSIKSLKLVGIVLDENSEAIVENPRKKETLFLRKGDEIEGAVVEEIFEGKIIFSYEGRKIELVQ